jgi:hypothetical protein
MMMKIMMIIMMMMVVVMMMIIMIIIVIIIIIDPRPVEEFSAFYGTRKFITACTRPRHLSVS